MDDTKHKILNQVKEYYEAAHKPRPFVAGKSKIPVSGKVYNEDELTSLVDSALDFQLTAWRYTSEFEKGLADYIGVKHAMFVNSGSSANLLAISALTSSMLGNKALKRGDEIITTAAAFPTTVNPIIQNGLVPVFVDVEIPTYNPSFKSVKAAITDKTRAILVAHTLGNPFDLDKFLELKERHHLFLIEDACDALGSKYKNRNVGTFGDIATLSFYPAHHITTGEGGAVVTNNDTLKKIVQSMRDWGRDCWCEPGSDDSCGHRFEWQVGQLPRGYDHKYIYSNIGYNLKPTDMQAAIGLAQLKKLPDFTEKRKRNFARLYEGLSKFEKYLILPHSGPDADPSWFGFLITVREGAPFGKNEIVRHLEERNIATRSLFGGNITRQPAYQNVEYRISGNLKNTDLIMNNTFWVGVYPGLSDQHIDYMVESFKKFLEKF